MSESATLHRHCLPPRLRCRDPLRRYLALRTARRYGACRGAHGQLRRAKLAFSFADRRAAIYQRRSSTRDARRTPERRIEPGRELAELREAKRKASDPLAVARVEPWRILRVCGEKRARREMPGGRGRGQLTGETSSAPSHGWRPRKPRLAVETSAPRRRHRRSAWKSSDDASTKHRSGREYSKALRRSTWKTTRATWVVSTSTARATTAGPSSSKGHWRNLRQGERQHNQILEARHPGEGQNPSWRPTVSFPSAVLLEGTQARRKERVTRGA